MLYLCPPPKKGLVAEWLGSALQKLLQRFESARDLTFFPASAGFFLPFPLLLWAFAVPFVTAVPLTYGNLYPF